MKARAVMIAVRSTAVRKVPTHGNPAHPKKQPKES